MIRPCPATAPQHGAALLLILIALLLAGSYALTAAPPPTLAKARKTEEALAAAREALIAWSTAQGTVAGTARPGELPCPDTYDPASSNAGTAAASCTTNRIGRFPWRTLGYPEQLDGDGERLWYVVDNAFRRTSTQPINSDTRATLTAWGERGTRLLTPDGGEAAAIILSAGAALAGQPRGTSAERVAPGNYLETALGKTNAGNSGPFLDGPLADAAGTLLLNDRLLAVSARDLMDSVEKRVAGEALRLLRAYHASNGAYPYPAPYNQAGCLDVGSSAYLTFCASDANTCRGRFPDAPRLNAYGLPNWTNLPGWFLSNLWGQLLYYAVGTGGLKTPGATLSSNCAASLQVADSGHPGDIALATVVLITPGSPLGTLVRSRPAAPVVNQSTRLADYLEDAANQDGWSGGAGADSYLRPTGTSRDRLHLLP